jgi:hypothetical protein
LKIYETIKYGLGPLKTYLKDLAALKSFVDVSKPTIKIKYADYNSAGRYSVKETKIASPRTTVTAVAEGPYAIHYKTRK